VGRHDQRTSLHRAARTGRVGKIDLHRGKHNQVAFKVIQDATKQEVKAAVELLFKVQVQSVQILNRRGKDKRFGRTPGRRSDARKAYVCLKDGQEINFAEGVK